MFTFSTITPENPIDWVILSDSEDEDDVQDNESYDAEVEDLKATVDQQKDYIDYAHKTIDSQNNQIDKLLDAADADQTLFIQKDVRIAELEEELNQTKNSYDDMEEMYRYENLAHQQSIVREEQLRQQNTVLQDELIALKKLLRKIPLTESEEKKEIMISCVEYSEKSFAIFGDTRPYKDAFIKIGGKFNRNLKHPQNADEIAPGWIFYKKLYNDVMDILGV